MAEKIDLTCENCCKQFSIDPTRLYRNFRKGRGKFCSVECYNDSGKVERVCPVCSRIFETTIHYLKIGNGKYCSSKCAMIYIRKLSNIENIIEQENRISCVNGICTLTFSNGNKTIFDEKYLDDVKKYVWWQSQSSKGCLGKWYIKRSFYNNDSKPTTQTLHRFIMELEHGKFDGEVDHVNGDTFNNTKQNLRITNRTGNSRNKEKTKRLTTSKYKGVMLVKRTGNWMARITVNYKSIHLGTFYDEIEAARTYDEAAKKYFGEYACLNFPEDL